MMGSCPKLTLRKWGVYFFGYCYFVTIMVEVTVCVQQDKCARFSNSIGFFYHVLKPAKSMVDALAKQGVDRISHFIFLLLCSSGRV